MNNNININNVSFQAHLSLKNGNLYKHVSRDMANEFAKATRDINGTMVLQKNDKDFLKVTHNNEEFFLLAKNFYSASAEEKVDTLKRSLRYLVELARFKQMENVKDVNINAHRKRLDKIAKKNESMWLFHDIISDELLNRLG